MNLRLPPVLLGFTLSMASLGPALAERHHDFQGEGAGYVPFLDTVVERAIAPPAERVALAQNLPARLRWNHHGTPKLLFNDRGWLSAPSSDSPEQVARQFLRQHAGLFGLSESGIAAMETLRVSPLHDSPQFLEMLQGRPVSREDVPHVVLLRQTFGGLPAAGREGLVTIGVGRDGRVGFVGSSLAPEAELSGSFALSELAALSAAAADVGMTLGSLSLTTPFPEGFSTYASDLLSDVQRVRRRALPVPGEGVRAVYEVTLLDSSHDRGHPQAFIIHLDAQTGRVWTRDNQVQHLSEGDESLRSLDVPRAPSIAQFMGETPAGACSAPEAFEVTGEDNGQIIIAAQATTVEDDDITIRLSFEGNVVAEQDLLTSPELLLYSPAGGVPPGDYLVEICPFNGASAPPIGYAGAFLASPNPAAGANPLRLPSWKVFPVSPIPEVNAPAGTNLSEDTRELWCWRITGNDPREDNELGGSPEDCDIEVANFASRSPWDTLSLGLPTFTTQGNNATTAVSNVNFVAPDTVALRPVALDRQYNFEWTNSWYESGCSPLSFVDPLANFADFEAATANLFVQHNRVHDWAYLLGWTEVNSTLQFDNHGNTGPTRGNDGEVGSSQAGRLTLNGRDNANQLTLQDGIPGITNQYLWQALPAAIYAPCVDGSYDLGIIVHEVTHATSNRMTGGPDGALGGGQAGKMGESWSDLAAVEFIVGNDLEIPGSDNPFAVAAYATGNDETGIRNYSIANSPLSYSSMEYDPNGLTSPHADSEIWGATQFTVRQALIEKFEAQFPSSDGKLQRDCATGVKASTECPGNRRWIHLLYDGMLLQPAGPSMLDSRDAMLAADLLRYDGENLALMWDAFAQRGMGVSASTTGVTDAQPIPGYDSPLRADPAMITFAATGSDGGSPLATIYVGDFEARATPSASLNPEVEAPRTVAFVPGTYRFFVQAPGYGLQRFTETFVAGETRTLSFPLRANYAAAARGAAAGGDGDSEADLANLIDETENTSWSSTSAAGTASEGKGEGEFVAGRQVTVALAEPVMVDTVQVSALLQPGQSRFSALLSFDLQACDSSASDCSQDDSFKTFYQSPDDAFPGNPLRPTVAALNLRSFEVPATQASHVRIVVRDSQCTGNPSYQRERFPVNGDPFNDPDCDTGFNLQLLALAGGTPSNVPNEVRINELQVFGKAAGEVAGAPQSTDGLAPGAGRVAQGGALGSSVLIFGLAAWLARRRRWL
jgi:hypothetical protein